EDFMSGFFQTFLNPRGQGSLSPRVVEQGEHGEMIQKGLDMAVEHVISNDALGMPDLEAYSASPEIIPGLGDGTLFLEMFAKVVTGRVELDSEFDKFVKEWKKRGGDEAFIEATEWYNENN